MGAKCDYYLQIHVHIKRRLMKELPETDDGIAQWCKDVFVAKACIPFLGVV